MRHDRAAAEEQKEREKWTNFQFLMVTLGLVVGVGNIWKFPYLLYENGGVTFFIPYIIGNLIAAIPLMIMEISLGQFHRSGIIGIWKFCPLFRGVGLSTVVATIYGTYICAIFISWSVFYIWSSFNSVIDDCNNKWNTDDCVLLCDVNKCFNKFANFSSTSFNEFYTKAAIPISKGITVFGNLNYDLILPQILLYFTCFCCSMYGVKIIRKLTSGAILGSVGIILILFGRCIALEGGFYGIMFMLRPQPIKLVDPKVWFDAFTYALESLRIGSGGFTALATFNSFRMNVIWYSYFIAVANVIISILYAGIVFSSLGYISKFYAIDIEKLKIENVGTASVLKDVGLSVGIIGIRGMYAICLAAGPVRMITTIKLSQLDLIYLYYPLAFASVPGTMIWHILFYFSIVLVGFNSQIVSLFAMMTDLIFLWKEYTDMYKIIFLSLLSIVLLVLGLLLQTEAAYYIIQLVVIYVTEGWYLLYVNILFCVLVAYFYDADNLRVNLEVMIRGYTSSSYYKYMWKYILPISLSVIVFVELLVFEPLAERPEFAWWADYVGLLLMATCILWIPIYGIKEIKKRKGSLSTRFALCLMPEGPRTPSFSVSDYSTSTSSEEEEEEEEDKKEKIAKKRIGIKKLKFIETKL